MDGAQTFAQEAEALAASVVRTLVAAGNFTAVELVGPDHDLPAAVRLVAADGVTWYLEVTQ